MSNIHCHVCGGFIGGDPRGILYQNPEGTVLLAAPRSALCGCEPPVRYESASMRGPALPAIEEAP